MCLTIIDPATSWFEMVELPVMDNLSPNGSVKNKCSEQNISTKTKEAYFEKSSLMISNLVNKCWFSSYPRCCNIIFDDGSEFKLHFITLCESYGVNLSQPSLKPTSKLNTGTNPPSCNDNGLYFWDWYGWLTSTQGHRYYSNKRIMGHPLYLSHGT